MRLLISSGAQVLKFQIIFNKHLIHPIATAAANGHVGYVKALLEAGCNPEGYVRYVLLQSDSPHVEVEVVGGNNGRTAVELAEWQGSSGIAEMFQRSEESKEETVAGGQTQGGFVVVRLDGDYPLAKDPVTSGRLHPVSPGSPSPRRSRT